MTTLAGVREIDAEAPDPQQSFLVLIRSPRVQRNFSAWCHHHCAKSLLRRTPLKAR